MRFDLLGSLETGGFNGFNWSDHLVTMSTKQVGVIGQSGMAGSTFHAKEFLPGTAVEGVHAVGRAVSRGSCGDSPQCYHWHWILMHHENRFAGFRGTSVCAILSHGKCSAPVDG